ncbi:DUF4180 domain-containing protein [Paenibacillus dendritiformis]|uniref:DUF4180 domain-containing protein n=1 Tax=Paenibacillus dendritiformis TaxID=130049 RepID=UPI00143DA23D|nr:DUF4180 domain-containing protein [Paenibacillus dendritiformis]NKI24421.1 DUF4180 domain-containing protein [Paenibacillus dendritiformis]NRG00589.1 DUF4180 domain-containing protein [Paenibacillus dendritiformis]
MSIKYAILGLLSWKPATGYELKKIFEDSSAMYWSGNNNQIYKSLVQLLNDGLVTNEVKHQESSPSKKIYSITEEGLARLKDWVLEEPDVPELKNTFLIQLAWADQLSDEEVHEMLDRYESSIHMQLVYQQEKRKRGVQAPNRNERESFLWEKIAENQLSFYQNELKWVQGIRKELDDRTQMEERTTMNYKIVENGTKKYIELISGPTPLSTEQDAADLVALCREHDLDFLMLHGEALSEDFFNLRTGVAGRMMQKFITYSVKTAVVIPDPSVNKGRFKEMVTESNRSNQFGVFASREDAESWLIPSLS